MSLIRKEEAVAWELRSHLWKGSPVVVTVEAGPEIIRLRGYVESVSATSAFAEVDDDRYPEPRSFPIRTVKSIRRPHFHEDETVLPVRPRAAPDGEQIPGQLRLGAERIPEVSRRGRGAMERAASMLLPQDLLDALWAVDKACKGRARVSTAEAASLLGRSPQWTVRRLARLAEMHLLLPETGGRRIEWGLVND